MRNFATGLVWALVFVFGGSACSNQRASQSIADAAPDRAVGTETGPEVVAGDLVPTGDIAQETSLPDSSSDTTRLDVLAPDTKDIVDAIPPSTVELGPETGKFEFSEAGDIHPDTGDVNEVRAETRDASTNETGVWEVQSISWDAQGIGDGFGTQDQTCGARGALSCAGPNQQQTLICRGGVWQAYVTCDVHQRCDQTSGTCTSIVTGCEGHDPGYGTCQGGNIASICGPDLVTAIQVSCSGLCVSGACQPPVCGDGKIEGAEACDDGNTAAGDGCEPDCTRTQVVQLAAGWTQSCALFNTGQIRCWGGNDHGQLGIGTNQDLSASLPYELGPLALGGQAVFVAAGFHHACALMSHGSVQCWGRNDSGQLGLGHSNDIGDDELPSPSISTVPLGISAKQIAAGGDTTCALLIDDSLRCWGRNDFGQLGLGHSNSIGDNELPTDALARVQLGGTPISVAVAGDHTCALLSTNEVRCWGHNSRGELGIGSTDNIGDNELPSSARTISFPDDGKLVALTAGGYHTCVHEESVTYGSINRCWGYDGDGSLGVGYIEDKPLALGSGWPYVYWGFPIDQLSCGLEHTCVLLDSHNLRCFGLNEMAQLGLPSMAPLGTVAPPNSVAPIDFGADSQGATAYATLIATGAYHSCALLNTGELRCWGMNADGQLGFGYKSAPPTTYVGGTPDTTPGKLPAVKVFP